MSTIERILGIYIESIWREGERLAKVKSLSLALHVMEGWRKVSQSYFIAFIGCMLLTASIFGAVGYNLNAPELRFDLFNLLMILIAATSLFTMTWSLREKTWLNAFGIQKLLIELSEPQKAASKTQSNAPFDQGKFLKLIDQLLDEKLKNLQVGAQEKIQVDTPIISSKERPFASIPDVH